MFYFRVFKFSFLLMFFMSSIVIAADNGAIPRTTKECLINDSFAQAEQEYWEMLESTVLKTGVINRFFNALIETEQYDDAKKLFDSVIDHEWIVDSITKNIGLKYLFMTNQYSKAEELFESIPQNSRSNHSFYWMFRIYSSGNDWFNAEAMFKNIDFSRFLDPNIVHITTWEMATLYNRNNQLEKAALLFRQLEEASRK